MNFIIVKFLILEMIVQLAMHNISDLCFWSFSCQQNLSKENQLCLTKSLMEAKTSSSRGTETIYVIQYVHKFNIDVLIPVYNSHVFFNHHAH